MKNFKFLLFTFLLILSFNQFANAQTGNTFTSLTGGFSINLPNDIRGTGGNGTAGGIYFKWQQPEAEYEIGFYEVEGLPFAKIDGAFSFEQMVKRYFNKFSANGEKIYKKEISLQENEGREYKYKTASSIHILRLYKFGDSIYKVLAEIPLNKLTGEEEVLRVLDSFRFLDKEKVKAAMAKKLAEATPEALPQTPVVAKPKSDVQDRDLKGNVKSVLTEMAFYAVKNSLRKKQPRLLEEFGREGNLLKSIEYDSFGNAFIIRVFGYVSGKRVSRNSAVSYEYDFGGIEMSFPASAKPDKRFDGSYTYKYVGDNLVEERTFFSNGILQRRAAIRYLKNKREVSYFDDGKKPFQQVVFTLDEKGNETEIVITEFGGMLGTEFEKFKVEYESFDEKGNWTKRTVSKWYGFENEGNYSPEYVEHRTITYYE